MALTHSSASELGSLAPDFSLKGTDGKTYSLADFKDARALVVIFMCNHCPYVIAVQDRINALAKEYGPRGVRLIGINSNDPVRYPDDNFEAMKQRAKSEGFAFPYLQDLTQDVARAYKAVCTPEPFMYERVENAFLLRYHGRIDDNWKQESAVTRRDLAISIDATLTGRAINTIQQSSMGCSIKWS